MTDEASNRFTLMPSDAGMNIEIHDWSDETHDPVTVGKVSFEELLDPDGYHFPGGDDEVLAFCEMLETAASEIRSVFLSAPPEPDITRRVLVKLVDPKILEILRS